MGQYETAVKLLKDKLGAEILGVGLDCGHFFTAKPPPRNGDNVWCDTCRSYVLVPYTSLKQWKVKCESCRMTRNCGRDKSWAVNRARKHLLTRGRDHVVNVWWTGNRDETTERVTIPDKPLPTPDAFPF